MSMAMEYFSVVGLWFFFFFSLSFNHEWSEHTPEDRFWVFEIKNRRLFTGSVRFSALTLYVTRVYVFCLLLSVACCCRARFSQCACFYYYYIFLLFKNEWEKYHGIMGQERREKNATEYCETQESNLMCERLILLLYAAASDALSSLAHFFLLSTTIFFFFFFLVSSNSVICSAFVSFGPSGPSSASYILDGEPATYSHTHLYSIRSDRASKVENIIIIRILN